jgi:hypothetical protein
VAPTGWAPRWTLSQPPVWGSSTMCGGTPFCIGVQLYVLHSLMHLRHPLYLQDFEKGGPQGGGGPHRLDVPRWAFSQSPVGTPRTFASLSISPSASWAVAIATARAALAAARPLSSPAAPQPRAAFLLHPGA